MLGLARTSEARHVRNDPVRVSSNPPIAPREIGGAWIGHGHVTDRTRIHPLLDHPVLLGVLTQDGIPQGTSLGPQGTQEDGGIGQPSYGLDPEVKRESDANLDGVPGRKRLGGPKSFDTEGA